MTTMEARLVENFMHEINAIGRSMCTCTAFTHNDPVSYVKDEDLRFASPSDLSIINEIALCRINQSNIPIVNPSTEDFSISFTRYTNDIEKLYYIPNWIGTNDFFDYDDEHRFNTSIILAQFYCEDTDEDLQFGLVEDTGSVVADVSSPINVRVMFIDPIGIYDKHSTDCGNKKIIEDKIKNFSAFVINFGPKTV